MNGQYPGAIRGAFASGEFTKARRLWCEYAGQLEQSVAGGTATSAMFKEARELIDWSALIVKVFRAHAASQLTSLYLAGIYQNPQPELPAKVRVCL